MDPKSDRIAWGDLTNFGKHLALWLQLVFLHVWEAFGTILGGFGENVGTIFEEIRQDLDGLAEIF